MVQVLYRCERCLRLHEKERDAYECEASSLDQEIEPLETDRFYTLSDVALRVGIKSNTIAMWLYRRGAVFVHMVDLKDVDDLAWAKECKPELVNTGEAGGPPRYWVPERDVRALEKALQIFGSITEMRSKGIESVQSEMGGEFRYPA